MSNFNKKPKIKIYYKVHLMQVLEIAVGTLEYIYNIETSKLYRIYQFLRNIFSIILISKLRIVTL